MECRVISDLLEPTVSTMVDLIREKTGFIAPIVVYPGEDEMLALSQRAIRVLNG